MASKWIRVTRKEPCPICGRQDWCGRTADGKVVHCMRVESRKAVASGGWIHRLEDPLPPKPIRKAPTKKRDWTDECREMYEHKLAAKKRGQVARQLVVSVRALVLLRVGIGWDANGREFSSWPSRDDTGRCIGFVRRYDSGAKKTNRGGSSGVFYTPTWQRHPGPVYIVEGGSDVAACESFGLAAIGRASNVYGGGWIRRMLQGLKRPVIVVGERDENPEKRGTVSQCPVDCPGCAFCWPGKYGMEKVAKQLGARPWMIPEPWKDIREALTAVGLDVVNELRS
jgi:hypothetical protein